MPFRVTLTSRRWNGSRRPLLRAQQGSRCCRAARGRVVDDVPRAGRCERLAGGVRNAAQKVHLPPVRHEFEIVPAVVLGRNARPPLTSAKRRRLQPSVADPARQGRSASARRMAPVAKLLPPDRKTSSEVVPHVVGTPRPVAPAPRVSCKSRPRPGTMGRFNHPTVPCQELPGAIVRSGHPEIEKAAEPPWRRVAAWLWQFAAPRASSFSARLADRRSAGTAPSPNTRQAGVGGGCVRRPLSCAQVMPPPAARPARAACLR